VPGAVRSTGKKTCEATAACNNGEVHSRAYPPNRKGGVTTTFRFQHREGNISKREKEGEKKDAERTLLRSGQGRGAPDRKLRIERKGEKRTEPPSPKRENRPSKPPGVFLSKGKKTVGKWQLQTTSDSVRGGGLRRRAARKSKRRNRQSKVLQVNNVQRKGGENQEARAYFKKETTRRGGLARRF